MIAMKHPHGEVHNRALFHRLDVRFIGEEALTFLTDPDPNAYVHSIFRHAIIILSSKRALVVLATSERAPWAINLTRDTDFTLFRITRSLTAKPGSLTLGSSLLIDYSKAELWKTPVIFCHHGNASVDETYQRLRTVANILTMTERRAGFGDLLTSGILETQAPISNGLAKAAKSHVEKLVEAIVQQRTDLVVHTTTALAGLGIGSTPSGDDFLAGLMLGFRYARQHFEDDIGYVSLVCQTILTAAAGRTNPISWAYIQYASRGLTTESIFSLISSLLGHKKELTFRTMTVMQKRATSGEDIIVEIGYGVLAAIRQYSGERAITSSTPQV
jgi:hypothetical protein